MFGLNSFGQSEFAESHTNFSAITVAVKIIWRKIVKPAGTIWRKVVKPGE